MNRKDEKIIKVLKFIILFSVVFVLLSTASTLFCNSSKWYSKELGKVRVDTILSYVKVDKKAKQQADNNLEKIMNAKNTNYNAETKEKIIKGLKDMGEVCDELEKIPYNKRNAYDAAKYALKIKDGVKNIGIIGTIRSADKRSDKEKEDEKAWQMYLKSIEAEITMIEIYYDVLNPSYQYPYGNDNETGMAYNYLYTNKYNKFTFTNYYLALTEYAMEVGGINE